ncbi:MAG: hypothetical protein D6732_26410 [Methanobacteriota archaeon]|nr:MAG: hypothetical protein D6732_26410 [Euryarchaeota archaeon]
MEYIWYRDIEENPGILDQLKKMELKEMEKNYIKKIVNIVWPDKYKFLSPKIKLYKRLIIEKLCGSSVDSALLDRLLTEIDESENVEIPEDKRGSEKDILDFITNEIITLY